MEIFIAKHAGFCEGVERAYKIAMEESKKGKPTYILGDLVHNAEVIKKLHTLGVKTVQSLNDIIEENATLVISAHGVSPEVIEKAKSKKLNIVDTTCPWVTKAQKLAKKLADKGYHVIIIGDKGHREVQGVLGWAGKNATVVQKGEAIPQKDKIGVVAQTTQSEKTFKEITSKIKCKEKKLHNTICGATHKRQNAAVELAKKVEIMLVIGDQKSANTKRLTELCSDTGTETHQIQTEKELDLAWLKDKEKIGITAGASTPDWVIDKVLEKLKK